MSILATIKDHSGRIYRGIQALLVLSIGASALGAFDISRNLSSASAFTVSSLATGLALLALMYMRSSVVHRLRSAAAAEAEKHHVLTRDAMTGAMTRRYFLEALRDSLGTMRERREATLLLIDVDHFKQLNDTFGHQFGDLALAHLVKTSERIFAGGMVGRLGGDEFGVIIPHGDLVAINKDIRQLLDVMRAGKSYEGKTIPLSVSVGVALAPVHASNTTELMLVADLALYESKAAGRGRVTVFDEEMLSDKRYRRLVERELRAAVYLGELELHYQPIVNPDGSTYAFEGLIRWRHPVRGLISPAEFIPIAERSTLIDMLGEWVFKRACADISHFPGRRISINVSGEQLKRDEIVTMCDRVLKETGRSAAQFIIEITETVATAATPEILRRLEALRGLGFHIALDDFGTGHCGFNYLKTLPIDSIKIDRSYISSLAHDQVAQIFVSALAQIARIQDVTIVAEGVETQEEFALAQAAGCNRFQGYFLGRPAPRDQVASSRAIDTEPMALSA
ncbi:putative bifunctional diguanylate cyclase/phosphodiesterase [Mesorhizobium erdmanii]|uniref:Bifunctional diguanylate cyclase/phosphodiesterase n=1 Tax=Mesorhizobium erdmanii TaxID=1777866 RepID=A0A6M7UJ49_9HYPH|nr:MULTISPECIES: bifunctional diguanylate cyclase/phosphodiesterase [Mesorhizobium]OBQ69892.1 diguanylate phosphodiesterase [Mesorhizobium loti]QKC76198.1 bifunctional diguanylate cyclase/phosphodiesterase [Mesorhizobium erdmanii]